MKSMISPSVSDTPKSTLKSASRCKISPSDDNLPITKTPQKPMETPRRTRNRGVVLSLAEVKKIAKGLQTSKRGLEITTAEDVRTPAYPVTQKRKSAKSEVKLPEKYEILAKFFDSLESSVRLLRMKRTMPTFENVSRSIESLTDRRFSHSHLAQLKFICQEFIDLKKVLVHDEKTLCMKPHLQITLQVGPNESRRMGKESGSGHMDLRKEFRARLLDFFRAHPEGDDVPEEKLPEPFNGTRPTILSHIMQPPATTSPTLTPSETLPHKPFTIASHLSQSFQKRFSLKVPTRLSKESQSSPSATPFEPISLPIPSPCSNAVQANLNILSSKARFSKKSLMSSEANSRFMRNEDYSPTEVVSKTSLISCEAKSGSTRNEDHSPAKIFEIERNEDHSPAKIFEIERTPTKLVSTPLRLMSSTPELQLRKRYRLSPSDSPSEIERRATQPRSLKFQSPVKIAKAEEENDEKLMSSANDDLLKILPQALLQSVREKERKAMEERDLGLAESRRRRQMISCLPKLSDMINLIFRAAKRSVITKHELMQKIIQHHLDVIDKKEIEEQMNLLQELLPDWISEKVISSGDFVFRINKALSSSSIHARLAVAE